MGIAPSSSGFVADPALLEVPVGVAPTNGGFADHCVSCFATVPSKVRDKPLRLPRSVPSLRGTAN